jgi:membrane metallo-endopeptidase-like protein 1
MQPSCRIHRYVACMVDGLTIGGWPVTMNETEWVEPPSLEVVIAKIRKIINNGILVDIWVGPDDRNSNEYILQVLG